MKKLPDISFWHIAYGRWLKSKKQTISHVLQATSGFSLVELLIALFLITITVFIFLKATDTLGRIAKTNHQTTAFHIASRKIESLRGGSFLSIPASGTFGDSQLSKLPQGSAYLTVSDYGGSNKIKQIESKVTWYEQSVAKEIKLTTLISENGLHK